MPHKLKKLNITKVDFVNAGANQRANIAIFKHAPKGGEPMGNTEKEKFESLVQAVTKAVIEQLKTNEPAEGGSSQIAKSGEASTFNDTVNRADKEKVFSEIWDTMDALRYSLMSIIQDKNVENKVAMLKQSLAEFKTVADQFAESWGNIQTAKVNKCLQDFESTEEKLNVIKKRYAALIEKVKKPSKKDGPPPAEPEDKTQIKADNPKDGKKTKEEDDEMNIDKSKMTPEELAFLEDIEKRYAVEKEPGEKKEEPGAPVKKTAEEVLKEVAPELADAFANIKKHVQKQEEAEMLKVAKKYEILGKKAEELAPILKKTKEANADAYNELIAALDDTLEVTKNSGMFSEVGKSGSGGEADAVVKINKFAEEIRKSKPELSIYEARDLAYQQHPELIEE